MKRFVLSLATLALALVPVAAQPEMPKPGPEQQKLLKTWEGEWTCTMDMMGTQGTGTAVCKPIMGGFFVQMDFKGEFMGMKMDGRSVSGYCPTRKIFQSTWIDSMSPSIMLMEGKFEGEKFVERGEGPNMQGQMEKMKSVTVVKDPDTIEMTMYKVNGDKEEKTMTLVYKRKK